MAVLSRLVKLPDDRECEILSHLGRDSEIWQPGLIRGGVPQKLFLCSSENEYVTSVFSQAEDVRFKFECFYLNLKNIETQMAHKRIKLGVIKCCEAIPVLRAEWERPALPNEVPAHYEQIVQRRGKLSDVPNESSACVSMVGILFVGENDSVRSLVYLDDFPLELGYTEDSRKIDDYLSECWTLEVDKIDELREKLKIWTASG